MTITPSAVVIAPLPVPPWPFAAVANTVTTAGNTVSATRTASHDPTVLGAKRRAVNAPAAPPSRATATPAAVSTFQSVRGRVRSASALGSVLIGAPFAHTREPPLADRGTQWPTRPAAVRRHCLCDT